MEDASYNAKKHIARRIYAATPSIRSPYFRGDVVLGFEGFQHLRYSSRGPRSREEQALRFMLLPLAIRVLQTASTVQEYRTFRAPSSGSKKVPRSQPPAMIHWWGFVALFIREQVKIRVVVRQIGTGKLHFWSLMPYRDQKMRVAGARLAERKRPAGNDD